LAHITVTEGMHTRFCSLFAVGLQTRAVQALAWSVIADASTLSGQPAIRFHEWWALVHTAKDKAGWSRKMYALESPLAAAVGLPTDWSRIGYIIIASLDANWSECLSADALDPTLAELDHLVHAHIEGPGSTQAVNEPLWALIHSSPM
jgi:hypothetical protein